MATIEQKAMAESGYEFDFDKKELKKLKMNLKISSNS